MLTHDQIDVNKTTNNNDTVLMCAIYHSKNDEMLKIVVELLINAGADITIKNKCGDTALKIYEKIIYFYIRWDYWLNIVIKRYTI